MTNEHHHVHRTLCCFVLAKVNVSTVHVLPLRHLYERVFGFVCRQEP